MTPAEIDLVQGSFAKVVPIKDQAAALFYARLFDVAPDVRPLFKADLSEQGSKLMATLGVAVNGLKDLEAIVPVAQDLARRHLDYGVLAEHYPLVGVALLDTLEKGLGADFTPETKRAWVKAYTTLAGVMCEAAYGVQPAAGQAR
ncbi:MAG: globin family protein [Pseudomonadota bacterium]